MGDYTKTGVKIGTCGQAYYATKKQLEEAKHTGDPEVSYYLNPEKKCSFAFPYPEFDGKELGDISIFHKEAHELIVLEISKEHRTFHKQLTFHTHPTGGQGINLFCDCPYHNKENISRNFDGNTERFYLRYEQMQEDGNTAIVGECIYCGESNVFYKHEAEEAVQNLIKKAENLEMYANRPITGEGEADRYINEAIRLRSICARILEIYDHEN